MEHVTRIFLLRKKKTVFKRERKDTKPHIALSLSLRKDNVILFLFRLEKKDGKNIGDGERKKGLDQFGA